MRTLLGAGNLVLLVANLSTLGTVAYKSEFWRSDATTGAASLREALDLSQAQAEEIEVERESFARDWEEIETQLAAAREELLAAIKDEDSDLEQVWPMVDSIADLQARLQRQAVGHLWKERTLIPDGQKELYLSHVENRMRQGCGCMRGYRGGRGGRGQGGSGEGLGRGRRGRGWGNRPPR